MDGIKGWAGKMFMKQKMGNISDSLSMGGKKDEKPAKQITSKEMRNNLKDIRSERDAEYERKKAERTAKKGKMAERWAANKS
jgi:hypothetical protein